jgi:glycosyltransferase involved in cell wall biosynthesis
LPALKYCCYRGSRAATVPLAAMIALHRKLGTWRKQVDAMITLTGFQRDMLRKGGLPAGSMHIKPHFYKDAPAPLPWKDREDKVVYIGRLSAEKGPAVMIETWKRLSSSAPPLEVIGDGPDMGRLKDMIKGTSVEQRITFTGQLLFSETQERLGRAKMLILPSICFEGFPMVIREAFALGVPVIGSRIGAIPFIVTHDRNGMLFEPGNSADLAGIVSRLQENNDELADMAAAARREFDEKYTAGANLQTLIRIYETAIAKRRGRNKVKA